MMNNIDFPLIANFLYLFTLVIGVFHAFFGGKSYRKKSIYLSSLVMLILTIGCYRFLPNFIQQLMPFTVWINVVIFSTLISGLFLLINWFSMIFKFNFNK